MSWTPGTAPDQALVERAYSARAAEYTALLGHIDATAPEDRRAIREWAEGCTGTVVDVGCGPGHWSGHLRAAGLDVVGLDPAPEFVAHARLAHPDVPFRVGGFDDLPSLDPAPAAILSWYSLIHLDPRRVPVALATARSVLPPGGRLMVGFFDGDRLERFDHAVAPAYRWPVAEMAETVRRAGFRVTDTRTRHDPGSRPHAHLCASRVP